MTFVTYCDERRIPQPPKASIVDALAHYRGGLNSSSDDCSIISITFLKEATAIGRVVWPPQTTAKSFVRTCSKAFPSVVRVCM